MISNNVVCATSEASDQPAHMSSLIRAFASFEYSMSVKLLTEHHLVILSFKGGCKASLSLHLSKCHLVGNHMSRLIYCMQPDKYTGPYKPTMSTL